MFLKNRKSNSKDQKNNHPKSFIRFQLRIFAKKNFNNPDDFMIRRTRQQIEKESALISADFNDIRVLLGNAELEDSALKEELNIIVLERVGEAAFKEVQKKTLWQVATQDDIEQLKEKYLPRNLIHNSFEGFRNLDSENLAGIMSDSFDLFKASQGWPTKKGQYPYPNFHENVDEENGTYALPEKFHASKSRSLNAAIKELESQIKAGIENQVEEEQNQSQTPQEGGKHAEQKVAKSRGR